MRAVKVQKNLDKMTPVADIQQLLKFRVEVIVAKGAQQFSTHPVFCQKITVSGTSAFLAGGFLLQFKRIQS